MKKVEVTNVDCVINRAESYLCTTKKANYQTTKGYICTKWGIVVVNQYKYKESECDFVRMVFMHDSQCYFRLIDASYAESFLITLAKRFAQKIAEGK